jgi:hypothetical protein
MVRPHWTNEADFFAVSAGFVRLLAFGTGII